MKATAVAMVAGAVGALVALAVVGATGASKSRTIRAEQFEVVDEAGQVRASLGMTEFGPSLYLTDGKADITMNVAEGAPMLTLRDGNKKCAVLAVFKNGSALYLCGTACGTAGHRVVAESSKDGSGLILQDADGKVRIALGVGGRKNHSSLELNDADEKTRVRLLVTDEIAGVGAMDKYGNLKATLGEFKGKGFVQEDD